MKLEKEKSDRHHVPRGHAIRDGGAAALQEGRVRLGDSDRCADIVPAAISGITGGDAEGLPADPAPARSRSGFGEPISVRSLTMADREQTSHEQHAGRPGRPARRGTNQRNSTNRTRGGRMSAIVDVRGREILDSRGQSHRRGRGHARDGRTRPGRRAVGRLDRRPRGRRAPGRGQGPLPRQGRPHGRRERQHGDRDGRPRLRGSGAARHRPHHDRASTARPTSGSSARTRSSASPWPTPRAAAIENEHAALGATSAGEARPPARADDEHPQRRRPRRQQRRHPGVHGRCPSAPRRSPRLSAWASRSSTI